MTSSKGALEAEIANAIVKFQREQHGRGPQDVRAHLVGELILVRCLGIWTPIESKLCASDEGRKLVKSARQELRAINHREIEEVVGGVAGCRVLRSHCDVNVEAGEQMEVYVLERDLQKMRGF